MSSFVFAYVPCPWCGKLHDDGYWIQYEDPDKTVFVCLDCGEKYLDDESY